MHKVILEDQMKHIKITVTEKSSIFNNNVEYFSLLEDFNTGVKQKRKIETLKDAYKFFDFITKGRYKKCH